MLLVFAGIVTLLSFLLVGFMNLFKGYLHGLEKNIAEQHFNDRLNKEKYLEEVGYNVMNDPW